MSWKQPNLYTNNGKQTPGTKLVTSRMPFPSFWIYSICLQELSTQNPAQGLCSGLYISIPVLIELGYKQMASRLL